jgi:hypothetical protein
VTKSSYRTRAQIIIIKINHFALYYIYNLICSSKIVNNSPLVNEKVVLERMRITLQCLVVLERVWLKINSHSLCLYLVFMLVRAKNPHRYVVAKGISVLIARFAKAGYSVRSPIQKSGSGFWLNYIFTELLVAISVRLSCSDISK